MWIWKSVMDRWTDDTKRAVHALEVVVQTRDVAILKLETLATRYADAIESERARIIALEQQVGNLKAEAAAAKAYSDLWRVRVNHLEAQNADLLARALGNYHVPTPQFAVNATLPPPGVDFEDMGDEQAAAMGYADVHPMPSEPLGPETHVDARDPVDGLNRVESPTLLDDLDEEEKESWR